MMKPPRLTAMFILLLLAALLFPAHPALADTGPKPSVSIRFKELPVDERVYATLIAPAGKIFGPAQPASERDQGWIMESGIEADIWQKFIEYKDPDGYICYTFLVDVTESGLLNWGYYPPNAFKLLIYLAGQNRFVSSEKLERYAFRSEFTADINGETVRITHGAMWGSILKALGLRLLVTWVLELGLAYVMGIRGRRKYGILLLVNLLTQLLLTLLLYKVGFRQHIGGYALLFISAELAVIVAEAIVYTRYLDGKKDGSYRKNTDYIVYAVGANLLSGIAGIGLTKVFPGVF